MTHSLQKTLLCTAVLASLTPPAYSQEADHTTQMEEIVVRAKNNKENTPNVPRNLPAVTEGVTAQQIQENNNAVTSAETLKYLPSITVRERYIGDRNGVIATRTTGTVSPAGSILYADDLLLSNFLGNSFAYPPRWGLVSPEEIQRVDVIYGPFSALYPGNSMGGVVQLTTRMPEKFEAHANVELFQEKFSLYGTQQSDIGHHASASLGSKTGNLSFWITADHLDAFGHPMSFSTASVKPGSSASGTPVTGAFRDVDQAGAARLVFGGYSIDHSIQDNGKIKLAYDISPTVKATYTLGLWQLRSDTHVDSYLKTASGSTFYNGSVNIGGQNYTVSALNPSHAEAEHTMQGLELKSHNRGEWNWSAVLTDYSYHKDINRSSTTTSDPTQAANQVGTLQDMSGTGWKTLDLRTQWHPGLHEGKHQLSFGYHIDNYQLDSTTYNTTDWLSGTQGSIKSASEGHTQTQALYAQDAWRFAKNWKLITGGRLEQWQAYGGMNQSSVNNALQTANYTNRKDTSFSPKLSVSFDVNPDWILRGSIGQAYRYPTVTELFQVITGANSFQSNPNLNPEKVTSTDLSAEHSFDTGSIRLSLFQENKRDALISQTDLTNGGGNNLCASAQSCTYVQNVDRVRTQGVEITGSLENILLHGLDFRGSLTYARSLILNDLQNPAFNGNYQPRIPNLRATVVATFHQNDRLSYSLAARYSGRQFNSVANTDVNPDTYGGASRYFFVDGRISYKMAKQWTAALGVDNINNYKGYISPHPWPQRTVFGQVRFDY